MAIRTFTTRKYAGEGRIEELTPSRRRDYAGCMSGDPDENLARIEAKVGTPDEDVYVITYEGAVLAEWERNMHDDSDFYASVWDEESGTIKEVCWGTTRGWTYWNGCQVDATEEVIEKASVVRNAQRARLAAERANAEERVPSVNARVTITGGRKHNGKEGVVFWRGPDTYRASRWSTPYRVGVETAEGERFFCPAEYAEVKDPKTYTADDFPQSGTASFVRPGESDAYAIMAMPR